MDHTFTRRRILVGAGVAGSVAGCLGRAGDPASWIGGDGSNPDDDDDDGDTDPTLRFPAVDTGDVIGDFEDLDRWTISIGDMAADTDEWVHGSQSLRLESVGDGNSAGVFALFDDGLDLSGRHLSAAVKVQSDGHARVTAQLLAPDGSNQAYARRTVIDGIDDWIRIDFGYTEVDGEPDLSQIQELRLSVRNLSGQPVTAHIDDLRATPRADTPRAVLVFDGAYPSYYETVYPMLSERDAAAVIPVSRETIDGSGGLDVSELRELRDDGWDVASRPRVPSPLPQLDAEKQEAIISDNHAYLEGRGFPDGARYFFPPGYGMDGTTVDIARDIHEAAVTFGGAPNANPTSTRFVLSRFDGDEGASSRRLIDLAAAANQSVILGFGRIRENEDMTADELEELLDHLEGQGYDLVSLSELLGE